MDGVSFTVYELGKLSNDIVVAYSHFDAAKKYCNEKDVNGEFTLFVAYKDLIKKYTIHTKTLVYYNIMEDNIVGATEENRRTAKELFDELTNNLGYTAEEAEKYIIEFVLKDFQK